MATSAWNRPNNPMAAKIRAPKPQGRGIVKALGQKGTTGNFARLAAAKGKGAAIGALQNKLAKRRGQPSPFGGMKRDIGQIDGEFKNK